MPNSLTRQAGLKLGPIFLDTLVKHYFERMRKDNASKTNIQLRQDELLYDETFVIVKKFLDASTKHTVEELQAFSNTRTPSPPWVHSIRLVIPMSCCDDAATYLIEAFGGEEVMKQTVGGTKWWQVRGIKGVDAEWLTAKKDWQEAKRRAKEQQEPRKQGLKKNRSLSIRLNGRPKTAESVAPKVLDGDDNVDGGAPRAKKEGSQDDDDEPNGTYQPEMDEMRCILYSHGGGYYFGSIDQERYSIQRYARKIHGRVLAVNYRLSPQYPFPCAIQDLIAAYLFLIRPPPDASHRPVKPEHIVIAGDSAGGGLSLALLQVLRDSGLPLPAGAVLISPWCDFTHSFPSIFTNTDTDVIPATGLSLHKPSALWPPPSDDLTTHVRDRLHRAVHTVLHRSRKPFHPSSPSSVNFTHPSVMSGATLGPPQQSTESKGRTLPTKDGPMDVGSTASLPMPNRVASEGAGSHHEGRSGMKDELIWLDTVDGKRIEITQQIQLYAPNSVLRHPLVSPCLSYLGGLCPLFFIASDREVLRDEVIFAAHKAANPDRYPIREEVRAMYPALKGIESRYGPSSVHLQVYDDAAHVLPVLFSFTTPAKYCYRAIASFCKHVTKMTPASTIPFLDEPVSVPDLHSGDPIPVSASPGELTPADGRSVVAVPAPDGNNGKDKKQASLGVSGAQSMGDSRSSLASASTSGAAFVSDGNDFALPNSRDDSLEMQVRSAPISNLRTPWNGEHIKPPVPSAPSTPPSQSQSFDSPVNSLNSPTNIQFNVNGKGRVSSDKKSTWSLKRVESARSWHSGLSKAASTIRTGRSLKASGSGSAKGASLARNATVSGGIGDGAVEKEIAPPVPKRVLEDTPPDRNDSNDVAGPRFNLFGSSREKAREQRKRDSEEGSKGMEDVMAGDAIVYESNWGFSPPNNAMIRERVSTQGVIRPLEPDDELPALQVPPDLIGALSERALRRYVDGKERFDKKFSSTIKHIAKQRERNLKQGSQDTHRRITQLQHYLEREREAAGGPSQPSTPRLDNSQGKNQEQGTGVGEGLLKASASWSLAWALDGDERPPPSSIVARRDTEEALELARVADMAVLAQESEWNANNLWSVVLNFLTVAPDKDKAGSDAKSGVNESLREWSRKSSRFAPFTKTKTDTDVGEKAREKGKGP